MRIHLASLLTLALLLVSCDRSTTDPDGFLSVDGSLSVGSCTSMQSTTYIGDPWPSGLTCGQTHYVKVVGSADGDEKDEVSQGTAKLGTVLNGSYGLPKLQYNASASNPLIEVEFVGNPSGTLYYGQGTKADGITITRTNIAGGPNDPRTLPLPQLDRVILHELVQIIGFKEKNDAGGYPALLDCAIEVEPPPAAMNSSLCAHETQSIYAAFGLRDGYDVDLTREMVEYLVVNPSTAILEVDDSQAFSPIGGPGSLPSSGVSWNLTNSQSAVVVTQQSTSQITLKGSQVGSASLGATANPNSAVVWSGDWLTSADPSSITVFEEPIVTTVVVSPSSVVLSSSNTSELLTATAYDQGGNPMTGVNFVWSKSSPWIFLSGTGNTRTVTGCRDGPLPLSANVTVTAYNTNVSDNASVYVMRNYPYYC